MNMTTLPPPPIFQESSRNGAEITALWREVDAIDTSICDARAAAKQAQKALQDLIRAAAPRRRGLMSDIRRLQARLQGELS